MSEKNSVAILGSTGYVGLELVKILSKHPNVDIIFLGTENSPNISIQKFDSSIDSSNIPNTLLNRDFDYNKADTVFLALPHNISNEYVKLFYNKVQIIDLSADFRLDDYEIYKEGACGMRFSSCCSLSTLLEVPSVHDQNTLWRQPNERRQDIGLQWCL